jgi:hypothetical protein
MWQNIFDLSISKFGEFSPKIENLSMKDVVS